MKNDNLDSYDLGQIIGKGGHLGHHEEQTHRGTFPIWHWTEPTEEKPRVHWSGELKGAHKTAVSQALKEKGWHVAHMEPAIPYFSKL